MGGSVSSDNPIVVAAFHHALADQGIIGLALLAVAVVAWYLSRYFGITSQSPGGARSGEHPARRTLRIGFGLLWLLDGLLQAQPGMPIGLPSHVVTPAAATSPGWVQSLVQDAVILWTRHPVAAAAATVWIQIGIGAFLLLAPEGAWSRLAGATSAGWGLVVWVLGEAFGGMLGSGSSWLFGAPGAALFYAVAGVLLALPAGVWAGRRLGRTVLGGIGALLIGMAVLQAWPGRGFWHGRDGHGAAGSLVSMLRSMAATPQPGPLAGAVRFVTRVVEAHGWAVNLGVVICLALVGAGLLTGRRRAVGAAIASAAVLSVLVWVLVQDFGFFGGVGTDPNSMLPELVLLVAAWMAWREPAVDARPETVALPERSSAVASRARRPLQALAAIGAAGTVLLGAIPMAFASLDTHTGAIVSEALNGQPASTDRPAPPFRLTDQDGRSVSLGSLHGRTVALTFLDPVCTSDCPLIAQQFRLADERLGLPSTTAFVAVVDNPLYRSVALVRAFDHQEGLDGLPNWYYLTGSLAALETAWSAYGVSVDTLAAGSMVAHSDLAFVIDRQGRLRAEFGADPGGAGATSASLGTVVTDEMRSLLAS